MSILISNEILESVKKELQKAVNSVQIITAYCKETSLIYLNNCISKTVTNKRLLVRFRMDDIVTGSTDFSIIENAMQSGWDVYVRFDLHAKTYIIDNKRGLIGSANATSSGLGIGKTGNLEMATLVDVESTDIEKIDKLFCDAIHVDSVLLHEMASQIDKVKLFPERKGFTWDKTITNLFTPHIDALFSYELPDDFQLQKGEYFAFLDETYWGDDKKFKESLRWSNVYIWLVTVLQENDGCLYFGALSQKLHNILISDPKPYRKDVKVMLANLLSLIEALHMEEIVIDRPNYSQRIRLKKQ